MALIGIERLDTSPPGQLVKGMMPDLGVAILYGPSHWAKSLVAGPELCNAVNSGTPFFGHETVRGGVVYAMSEGQADAGVRFKARRVRERYDRAQVAAGITRQQGQDAAGRWLAGLPAYTSEGIKIMRSPFQLNVSPQLTETRELSRAANEMSDVADLALAVLDCAPGFTGGSITNDTTAKRFMYGARWLSDELDCLVLVIAHPVSKARGEVGLPGNMLFNLADWVARIEPDLESADGRKSATIVPEKVKSGPFFDPIGYVIEEIRWRQPATDEYGDEIPGAELAEVTSATVRPREAQQAGQPQLGTAPAAQAAQDEDLPDPLPAERPRRKRTGILAERRFRAFIPARVPEHQPDPADLPPADLPVPEPAVAAPAPEPPGQPGDPEPEMLALRDDLDATARSLLVGGLVSARCPVQDCEAEPGQRCQPVHADQGIVVLSQHPLVIAHLPRIEIAVTAKRADAAQVLAQFHAGQAPDSLVMLARAAQAAAKVRS